MLPYVVITISIHLRCQISYNLDYILLSYRPSILLIIIIIGRVPLIIMVTAVGAAVSGASVDDVVAAADGSGDAGGLVFLLVFFFFFSAVERSFDVLVPFERNSLGIYSVSHIMGCKWSV